MDECHFSVRCSAGAVPRRPQRFPTPSNTRALVIRAAPFKSYGNYQTAGTIEREFDGVRKEHRFIRADTYGSYEDAVNFTLSKARQIIDLQGVRIFD